MASTRIPEGFVLVPGRSVETATALLEAADKIKADRKLDVRTTTGGYHVTQAVAEEYQKAFPDAELEEGGADENGGEAPESLPVTVDSTREEIDAYGKSLDPKVDTSKAANKAEAIALLEAARNPQTAE